MPDLQKLQSDKERIINTIKTSGPSFPTRISREVQISPLFVSAILSELVSEKTLKFSNMKVGSSPIYYLPGQEEKLTDFSQYLGAREKEAFSKLKESQVLSDEEQEPVVRVAIRSLKDFAIPITVKIKGETKTFWKYFSLEDEKAIQIIQKFMFSPSIPEINISPSIPEINISPSIPEINISPSKTSPVQNDSIKFSEHLQMTDTINQISNPNNLIRTQFIPSSEKSIDKIPKTKKIIESKFANSIREYFSSKDFELLEELSIKKKEFISKTRLDTPLGKQEYYTIAKEKKKITEQDLALALQKAQEEKMPALILAPAELDKTAKPFIQQWRNLIKFEKINF